MKHPEKERKQREAVKKANRTVLRRTLILMALFGILAFLPLFYQLYTLQIVEHDEWEQKAVEQQTAELTVSASRGTIYDQNGKALAISATAYDVILSPKDIAEKEYSVDLIASGLADILGIDSSDIREKCQKTTSQYQKLASKVDSETENRVRTFIDENDLTGGIYLSPNTKRFYPFSTLAAQIVGFVNYDNEGAYGLEAKYDDILSGAEGRVVTAKNGVGTEMMYHYEDYYDAENGENLTLTLDSTIQYYCEKILQEGVEKYDVRNGGFVIAMDPNSGALLGLASSPTYDLNNYGKVTDPTLLKSLEGLEGEAYNAAYSAALNTQWRNKAIDDTYEPGSTFKSVVLASALEEGVVNRSSSFYCSGSVKVNDYTIRCSNRSGHGAENLAQAVGNSCNPAFISIAQKLGAETFYRYFRNFGLTEKTGIDLQNEGIGQVWSEDYFTGIYGSTSLATASFGQRFTVTPIQLITAATAVVNGGYLYTPHVLKEITDGDGNVVFRTDTTPVRQVVSEKTSANCREILENVVDGCITGKGMTGKNAYVAGYRIGGKTGTSQTLVKDEYIVSFLGFAPADDPQVVVLVAFDSPKVSSPGSDYCTTGWYISGGQMAAPMAGQLMADILDYMGTEKRYTSEEFQTKATVPALTGQSADNAKAKLTALGLSARTVGDGDTVTGQIPAAGVGVTAGSQVILYLGQDAPTDQVEVPDLAGLTPDSVQKKLNELGLYMEASGAVEYYTSATKADGQSLPPGTMADRGTVLTVHFSDSSVVDYVADN